MPILSKMGFSETVALAVLPLFGYLTTYIFQLGFCYYFQIPTEMIRIGVEDTINGTFVFAGLICVITLVLFWMTIMLPGVAEDFKEGGPVQRYHGFSIVLLVILSLVLVWWELTMGSLLWTVIMALVAVFISVHALYGFVISTLGPAAAASGTPALAPGMHLIDFLVGRARAKLIVLLACLCLLILAVGHIVARLKTNFSISVAQQAAIIQRYGDYFVCKPYTQTPFRLKAECLLLSMTAVDKSTFVERRLSEPPILDR